MSRQLRQAHCRPQDFVAEKNSFTFGIKMEILSLQDVGVVFLLPPSHKTSNVRPLENRRMAWVVAEHNLCLLSHK